MAARATSSPSVGLLDTPPFADYDDSDDDDESLLGEPSPHGETLRNAPRTSLAAAAVAWHNAVPTSSMCAALEADAATIANVAPGSTYWLEADEVAPCCAIEQFALAVLRFHACATDEPLGVEWWVQRRRSDGDTPAMGLHWDSDDPHKRAYGEHLVPWLATVTYLGSKGAPTLCLPAAADAHGRATKLRCGAFVSQPVPGKHLAFDGRLLHGTLLELAPAAVEGEEPYARTTVLVNIWHKHRPDPNSTWRLPTELAEQLSPITDAASFFAAPTPVTAEVAPPADADAWRQLKVGFAPLRALCEQTPGWRRLPLGFPFFHGPVHVRGLPPQPAPGSRSASLVHVPHVEFELTKPAAENSTAKSPCLPMAVGPVATAAG